MLVDTDKDVQCVGYGCWVFAGVEREEAKLRREIQYAAKKGYDSSVRNMCKDLVRSAARLWFLWE